MSHRSLTVAQLTFYLTGPVTSSPSPVSSPALAALYPVAAVCSVAGSSYCHAPSAAPPLCHQTTWSSLAPDPKSEFPAHLHYSQNSA